MARKQLKTDAPAQDEPTVEAQDDAAADDLNRQEADSLQTDAAGDHVAEVTDMKHEDPEPTADVPAAGVDVAAMGDEPAEAYAHEPEPAQEDAGDIQEPAPHPQARFSMLAALEYGHQLAQKEGRFAHQAAINALQHALGEVHRTVDDVIAVVPQPSIAHSALVALRDFL